MPCSSNGQRGRQVFRSGHSYLSNQPDTFSSNILTRSRFPKSKTWTKSGCQQASVTRPRVIAPTEAPCQILPLQASLESADREAQRSQHPQSVGSVKGQVVQATLLAVPAASASSSTASENTNPDTRRLIHKGRYKLVQPQGPSRSAPSAQRAAFVQQQSQHLGLHNRKRRFINSSLTVQQTAKRQHTWVRTSTVSQTQGTSSAAAPRSRPSTPALVRSTNSRKLQLVRKLSVSPAGSLSRHFSRNAVLAKRLLSARSLKSTRCSVLGVRAPGVVKPGRLQRIGGVLYKVGGSGSNKSLQRQLTPQTLQKDLAPQVCLTFCCFLAFHTLSQHSVHFCGNILDKRKFFRQHMFSAAIVLSCGLCYRHPTIWSGEQDLLQTRLQLVVPSLCLLSGQRP